LDVRTVAVTEQEGAVTDDYVRETRPHPADGREQRLFILRRAVDDERRAPQLDKVRSVRVTLADGADPSSVARLQLINTFGDLVIDRLRLLENVYNIEAALITEHAAYHFRNPTRMEEDEALLKAHVGSYQGPVEAYHGALFGDDGELVFTTDADHPRSICRVFPELSDELETRFIVPQASLGPLGFTPFRLVTPSPTRSGGGVYWARRVLPVDDPPPGVPLEKLTRHETFSRRLGKVLETAQAEPGLFWPFYTHLGGLVNKFTGDQVPSPYFDAEPLDRLQESVFNISGVTQAKARTWFTRGTVLYDFALMLRGIEPNLERPDGDTVLLRSWYDPALGKTLPRSRGQLYGLTFYVDDPARAEIRLDGERLDAIVINRPDETGRPSVTIAECDLRFSLFNQLDPATNSAGEIEFRDAVWQWWGAASHEPDFGRLTVAPNDNRGADDKIMAAMTIPLHGWAAPGAQLVSLRVRRSAGASFGIVLATRTGGRFYVGDRQPAETDLGDPTASYAFDAPAGDGPTWRRVTAPLHDLAWKAGAGSGTPMANHPLESVTLLCLGAPGSSVDLAQLEFLRPRSLAGADAPERGFCVGGHVPLFEPGISVRMARRGEGSTPKSAAIDQRGFFCFELTPRGIYEIWAQTGEGDVVDRRGRLIEVVGDNMTLVLDRADP
jgi:hypothetical protein